MYQSSRRLSPPTAEFSFERPNRRITQTMLLRLLHLREEQIELDELRREILARHDAGAAVEPGPLRLSIREVEKRQFTDAKLAAVLGRDEVNSLKERIEPTKQRHVCVHDTSHDRPTYCRDGRL